MALVTGANKGLGLEIARQLGKQGITVVLGARGDKAKKAAETLKAEGIDAHPLQLEVTNASDVAALPGYFENKFGRLDILVNNAGVNLDPEGNSVDVLRRTYEVNVFAPHAITQALLPLLKKSPAGRVVNQSSVLGSLETISTGGAGRLDRARVFFIEGCLEYAQRGAGRSVERHQRQGECGASRLGQDGYGWGGSAPGGRRRCEVRRRCGDAGRRWRQRFLHAFRKETALVRAGDDELSRVPRQNRPLPVNIC